jgi:hypothetical protein
MNYWIVWKPAANLYVSGTDEHGYPVHTNNKDEAFKFYDFKTAFSFIKLGYCLMKY